MKKPSLCFCEVEYLIDIADSRRMLGVIADVVEMEKERFTREQLRSIRKMNFSRISQLS